MEIAALAIAKDEFVGGLAADPQVITVNVLVTSRIM